MKRSMMMAMIMVFGARLVLGEEYKRSDACESIPQWALERAEQALRSAYPAWGAVPVEGDDGRWRCRTIGAYVRRYDKTVDGKRVLADIPLYVEKDGNIFIADSHGCFSIDRWKKKRAAK